RLGSERVPKKNLRFLDDKPQVAWLIETVRDSKLFDEVWVNSESIEIGELARRLGVEFYLRDQALASHDATSEHFVKDFLERIACEVLFQITPTSPFLTV